MTSRPVRLPAEDEARARRWEQVLVLALAIAGLVAVLGYAYEVETALVEELGTVMRPVAAARGGI